MVDTFVHPFFCCWYGAGRATLRHPGCSLALPERGRGEMVGGEMIGDEACAYYKCRTQYTYTPAARRSTRQPSIGQIIYLPIVFMTEIYTI